MKKYRITDEETGETFNVEEEEEILPAEDEELTTEETPAALTEDEINALKGLAAVAPKLVALVADNTADACETEDEDPEQAEDVIDACDEDEETEKVIDTDEEEKVKSKDSKKSFGAIEKQTSHAEDSMSTELDINAAWAKRYGGK